MKSSCSMAEHGFIFKYMTTKFRRTYSTVGEEYQGLEIKNSNNP
jgi:hypothetical protein